MLVLSLLNLVNIETLRQLLGQRWLSSCLHPSRLSLPYLHCLEGSHSGQKFLVLEMKLLSTIPPGAKLAGLLRENQAYLQV